MSLFEDMEVVAGVLCLLGVCLYESSMSMWDGAQYQRALLYEMTEAVTEEPCAPPCTLTPISAALHTSVPCRFKTLGDLGACPCTPQAHARDMLSAQRGLNPHSGGINCLSWCRSLVK